MACKTSNDILDNEQANVPGLSLGSNQGTLSDLDNTSTKTVFGAVGNQAASSQSTGISWERTDRPPAQRQTAESSSMHTPQAAKTTSEALEGDKEAAKVNTAVSDVDYPWIQASSQRGRGGRGRGRGGPNRGSNMKQRNYQNRRNNIRLEYPPLHEQDTDFKKFFLIKTQTESDKPWTATEIIKANNELEKQIEGVPTKVSELRNGTILVEVETREQSNKIQNLKNLSKKAVQIVEHPTLNTCKGTIRSERFAEVDDQILLEELSKHNVKDIYKMKRKVNGQDVNTGTIIITFNSKKMPDKVKIGWVSLGVREYIPSPRQCYRCQKFNHSSKTCRAQEEICNKCGKAGHTGNSCQRDLNCANCQEPHRSSDRKCILYKFEQEVIATKTRLGCDLKEARNKVLETRITPNTTYAEILKTKREMRKQQNIENAQRQNVMNNTQQTQMGETNNDTSSSNSQPIGKGSKRQLSDSETSERIKRINTTESRPPDTINPLVTSTGYSTQELHIPSAEKQLNNGNESAFTPLKTIKPLVPYGNNETSLEESIEMGADPMVTEDITSVSQSMEGAEMEASNGVSMEKSVMPPNQSETSQPLKTSSLTDQRTNKAKDKKHILSTQEVINKFCAKSHNEPKFNFPENTPKAERGRDRSKANDTIRRENFSQTRNKDYNNDRSRSMDRNRKENKDRSSSNSRR